MMIRHGSMVIAVWMSCLVLGCAKPSPAPQLTLDLGENVTLELILIPAGEFIMGSDLPEQRPAHRVQIRRPFYMGKLEVTNAQIRRSHSDFDSNDPRGGGNIPYQKYIRSLNPEFNGDDQPAVYIPWEEAVDFTEWLSGHTGMTVRLPTEAEWEYACRAGTVTRYSWGDNETQAFRFANTNDPLTADLFRLKDPFPSDDGFRATAPGGSYEPNPFGLFDMHGNVAEWTSDQWHESFDGAPEDGGAWMDSLETGKRVAKGGSFESSPNGTHYFSCQCSGRSWNYLGNRNFGTGFRIVVELPGGSS